MVVYLETIVYSPEPTTTISMLSYNEEITLLETALSVLTHTRILPGAITLDPSQNDKVISTGFLNK